MILIFTYYNGIAQITNPIDFTADSTGTVNTNQYLNHGVIFSGYAGSNNPIVHEYLAPIPFGKVLHSDDWYNALRINFVDTSNSSK